jgi:hypothetical protein
MSNETKPDRSPCGYHGTFDYTCTSCIFATIPLEPGDVAPDGSVYSMLDEFNAAMEIASNGYQFPKVNAERPF